MKNIKVGNKQVGGNNPVFIIAEMACSHNGDPALAKKLVEVAKESGVDAVQLQIFSVKDYISPIHPAFNLVKSLEMSPKDWTGIIMHAKKRGLPIFVAAYDRPSAGLANALEVDGFKLHSSDLSNPFLTKYIAKMKRPITLGTGASTYQEIKKGIKILLSSGNKKIILMHGYQNFPTRIEDVNLKLILKFRNEFGFPVGYQDHTDGDSEYAFLLPLVSLGLGVNVLEKHFTYDRAKKAVDYQSALNPSELESFVLKVRNIEKALGNGEFNKFSDDELNYRQNSKKSIVAARDLGKGHRITEHDCFFVRALPGIPPADFDNLKGASLRRDIKKYNNIFWADIKR